jgi:hypothetical protein
MDGVAIIRELLVDDAAVLALVDGDEERIVGGVLPADTQLDAIAITDVSTKDRNVLAPGASRHVTDRIEVTGFAATYPQLKALMRAVKRACADFIGSAAGLNGVTVHTDVQGPYFMNEQASLHMRSQDFIVGFTEAR